jgi:polyphosphate kinase
MLSNREIAQNFEVRISTLYNWRKTKPRLYRYLQNADYNFEQTKEINILLDRLAKEIEGEMTPMEIRFVIHSRFEAKNLDEIERMHRMLLRMHHKDLDSEMIFDLYEHIAAMSLIEKYIFYKRVYHFRQERREDSDEEIRSYFAEFMKK